MVTVVTASVVVWWLRVGKQRDMTRQHWNALRTWIRLERQRMNASRHLLRALEPKSPETQRDLYAISVRYDALEDITDRMSRLVRSHRTRAEGARLGAKSRREAAR